MPDINPYASPRADIEPIYITQIIPQGHPPGVWRMGYLLVMTPDGAMPQRCAMTNGPMETRDNSMVGFMGYTVPIPVSQAYVDQTAHHKIIARTLQIVGVLASLAGLALLNPSIELRQAALGLAAGILLLVGIPTFITGIVWQGMYAPALMIEYFTPQFVWLRGAHPDYLAALPEWPYGAWRVRR